MIWACDSKGRATYLSPEWLALTGLTLDQAKSWGWLDAVHPEDREVVQSVVTKAASSALDFTTTFRIRTRTGNFAWMLGGAMPSFSPQDGRFLGFLGSLSAAPNLPEGAARGSFGHGNAPDLTRAAGAPQSVVELIADHLLSARALAAAAGEEMLRSILDMGLLEAGQRLACSQGDENCSTLN